MQAYGGMTDTISQSGARGTSTNDAARLFAHH